MSAAFLADILRIENSIQSDPNQPCCICLESFGTMSPETGVIEYGVRLPCSHYVGSSCIATWLRSNHTCPLCRHVFFSAPSRPSLGHRRMADSPRGYPMWYALCSRLNLSNRGSAFAGQFAARLCASRWLQGHQGYNTSTFVGSVAIYVISHIMGST